MNDELVTVKYESEIENEDKMLINEHEYMLLRDWSRIKTS